MKNTKSGHDITSKIIEKLLEKSHSLGLEFAREWTGFLKEGIYRAMTPSGYKQGAKIPKKNYYKIGEKYAAWDTYPTSYFDYIGEAICIKSGWKAQHEYEGDAGPILGYYPWGQFKSADEREFYEFNYFVTTLEIKLAVEEATENFEWSYKDAQTS